MNIQAVLFDLDGTLLPMDQSLFLKTYLGMLAQRMVPRGYDPKSFLDAMWAGTAQMIKNDGSRTNEEAFWEKFGELQGERYRNDIDYIDQFYIEEFDKVQAVCGYTPKSAELVHTLKEMGLRVALATNPLFPPIAIHKRIAWAGLSPEDFEFCTTYQNSKFSKPNPDYYRAVAEHLGVAPEHCLMVGNDVSDDMTAALTGMKVFLLTDCLINPKNEDISQYPNGSFEELTDYIKANL